MGLALATLVPWILAPRFAPGQGAGISLSFGLLIVVTYAGHIVVTAWLWTIPSVRRVGRDRRARLIALPAALLTGALTAAVVLPTHQLRMLLLVFFAWQFDHFQRQNLGLVQRLAAAWSIDPLDTGGRRLVLFAGWCGVGELLARPELLGHSESVVPAPLLDGLSLVATGGFAASVVAAFVVICRNPLPAPVAAGYVVAVAFMAPVFLFTRPAAAASGLVVAHGLQYLWTVERRCRRAAVTAGRAGWPNPLAVLAIAAVGGVLLEAMSQRPLTGPVWGRLLFAAYLAIVMTHFAIDGSLWRRDDVRARALLASSQPGGR